eukprot:546008-Rhodomonas_salina.1
MEGPVGAVLLACPFLDPPRAGRPPLRCVLPLPHEGVGLSLGPAGQRASLLGRSDPPSLLGRGACRPAGLTTGTRSTTRCSAPGTDARQ